MIIEEEAAIRGRHHPRSVQNPTGWCQGCSQPSPCDAALLIAALDKADKRCPDCGLTASEIGHIHITAQEALR